VIGFRPAAVRQFSSLLFNSSRYRTTILHVLEMVFIGGRQSAIYTRITKGMKTLSQVDRSSHTCRTVTAWWQVMTGVRSALRKSSSREKRDVNVAYISTGIALLFRHSFSFFGEEEKGEEYGLCVHVRRETFRRSDLFRPLAYT